MTKPVEDIVRFQERIREMSRGQQLGWVRDGAYAIQYAAAAASIYPEVLELVADTAEDTIVLWAVTQNKHCSIPILNMLCDHTNIAVSDQAKFVLRSKDILSELLDE